MFFSTTTKEDIEKLSYDELAERVTSAPLAPVNKNASSNRSVFQLRQKLLADMQRNSDARLKKQQQANQRIQKSRVQASLAASTDEREQADMEAMHSLRDQLHKHLDTTHTQVVEPTPEETVIQVDQVPPLPDITPAIDASTATTWAAEVNNLAGQASSSQAPPSTPSRVFQEAVRSGSIVHTARARGSCSEAVAVALFKLMALSQDSGLAQAAYGSLLQLLSGHNSFLTGTALTLYTNHLHSLPTSCPTTWAPSPQDYLEILKAYHHKSLGRAPPPTSSNPAPSPTSDSAAYCLQLLLRFLSAQCELAAAGKLQNTFNSTGHIKQLLPALMHLALDSSVARRIEADLEAAVGSLLDLQDDTAWSRCEAEVAASLAALGPNHRSHIRVLKRLPSCPRGEQLRRVGALAMLRGLLQDAQAAKGRGRAAPKAADEVLQLLGPSNTVRINQVLQQCVNKDTKQPDPWKVISLLEAADIVLWSCASMEARPTAGPAEVDKYLRWLKALATGVSTNMAMNEVKLQISLQEIRYIRAELAVQ